jgi:Ni/Co efflux regulator RcnB
MWLRGDISEIGDELLIQEIVAHAFFGGGRAYNKHAHEDDSNQRGRQTSRTKDGELRQRCAMAKTSSDQKTAQREEHRQDQSGNRHRRSRYRVGATIADGYAMKCKNADRQNQP